MTVMIHLVKQQGGFKKPAGGLDQKTCPRCGGETLQSFGLMGGGFGPYVMCGGDPGCDWFYKEQVDGKKTQPRPTGRQRTRALWRKRGRR